MDNNSQIADIILLFDGDYELSPLELYEAGMEHFLNNTELYGNLTNWGQMLAKAQYDSNGNVIGWYFEDESYAPLRGEYDSITWIFAG